MEPVSPNPNALLTVSEAGRYLGLSASRVRQLADRGELTATRTLSGIRLFRNDEVERIGRLREKQDEVRDPSKGV